MEIVVIAIIVLCVVISVAFFIYKKATDKEIKSINVMLSDMELMRNDSERKRIKLQVEYNSMVNDCNFHKAISAEYKAKFLELSDKFDVMSINSAALQERLRETSDDNLEYIKGFGTLDKTKKMPLKQIIELTERVDDDTFRKECC